MRRGRLGSKPEPLAAHRLAFVLGLLTDMSTNALLQKIVEKPAMYFGNRDGYLRDIEAFDIGFATATEGKHCFIPVAFKEYIIKTLAPNNSGATWFSLIREHATGEKAQWDLFRHLWMHYEKRTSA